MSSPTDCSQNTDPLKLVREGTDQAGRSFNALDPSYAPVNERDPAHDMVFAQGYASLLKYFAPTDTEAGDWTPFFNRDVSAVLAVPAIEDVETYKANTQSWFDYLNSLENQANTDDLKARLGFLYGIIASLAKGLDSLQQTLPPDVALQATLANLIQSQLAPAFGRLIGYYKAGVTLSLVNVVAPPVQILRQDAVSFDSILNSPPSAPPPLSGDWTGGVTWASYTGGIAADPSVYGQPASVFVQINHCSAHPLFKSVFDQFLKVFARVVGDAAAALGDTLTSRDTHEPHYALFLAFLRLLEYARTSGNTLTQRHLDFYYRVILGLQEKGAQPGHVHLLVELAKQASSRDFAPGDLFKAGKDDQGKDVVFANESDVVANQAKVAALQNLYRHGDEPVVGSSSNPVDAGRLFASPVANSDDGLGAPLTSVDGSWHPFYNKIYTDGVLTEIRMPEADIGFAIASHYLLMAEGTRWIVAVLTVSGYTDGVFVDYANDIRCLLTTDKGWLEKPPAYFIPVLADKFYLYIELSGGDAPIVPYSAKVHGYAFQTNLPMLLVKLKQDDTRSYAYPHFQGVMAERIALWTYVQGVKSLAVSNDFGPLDTSKPFQPFGPSPVNGSSLVIGSKEVFEKQLWDAWATLNWQNSPTAYPDSTALPNVQVQYLHAGDWTAPSGSVRVDNTYYDLGADLANPSVTPVLDEPDFTPNALYSTQSRYGFVRLTLTSDFGQSAYQKALIGYLHNVPNDPNATNPGSPPTGPVASSLTIAYWAHSPDLVLNTSDQGSYENRPGQFFHLAPFGAAEQHAYLSRAGVVYLFPQFQFTRGTDTLSSEAELYIGVSGLAPPQTLSLLFQVADGTANPLAQKPVPHIDWSYLSQNEWVEFDKSEVQDTTDELLNSGIVTLAVPRDATNDNALFTTGLYWIRAAVHEKSDAVCRLQLVAAQALQAVFVDRGNSPTFSATPLPAGTISKLNTPDSAVKSVTQPFPSFGGRGAEQSQAFYTRISERLRHKNRAIDLWDYERLILEAFPQIFKVKCLNHTRYEPSETGTGIYRELAPGHVTIVTVPNLQMHNLRDPLKPFTSLGLLQDIETFLIQRTSCFAQLHVKNPQFEAVRLRFSLRLRDGYDETYYPNLLRTSITRFLSPWAFADGGAPSFGGKIYKSVLVNFVEEQPYVDYVTDFQLFQDIAGVAGTVDLDEVEGSRAVSILVSAPESKHEITLITSSQDTTLAESCLCGA